MRLRKQTPTGDYQFGHSLIDFWHDEVEGVGQSILTRLLLYRGEWFLDTAEGTPWGGFAFNDLVIAQAEILGNNTAATRDVAIKQRVLGTTGVDSILEYSSNHDPNTRRFSVQMLVRTIYGVVEVAATEGGGVTFAATTRRWLGRY